MSDPSLIATPPDGIDARLRGLVLRAIGRQRDRLRLTPREVLGVAGLPAGSLDDHPTEVLCAGLRVLRRLHPVRPVTPWRAHGWTDAGIAALLGGPSSEEPR